MHMRFWIRSPRYQPPHRRLRLPTWASVKRGAAGLDRHGPLSERGRLQPQLCAELGLPRRSGRPHALRRDSADCAGGRADGHIYGHRDSVHEKAAGCAASGVLLSLQLCKMSDPIRRFEAPLRRPGSTANPSAGASPPAGHQNYDTLLDAGDPMLIADLRERQDLAEEQPSARQGLRAFQRLVAHPLQSGAWPRDSARCAHSRRRCWGARYASRPSGERMSRRLAKLWFCPIWCHSRPAETVKAAAGVLGFSRSCDSFVEEQLGLQAALPVGQVGVQMLAYKACSQLSQGPFSDERTKHWRSQAGAALGAMVESLAPFGYTEGDVVARAASVRDGNG
eukprot:scaffold2245_cov232-Pinguiococcus_pyrenoidosus.AAC.9